MNLFLYFQSKLICTRQLHNMCSLLYRIDRSSPASCSLVSCFGSHILVVLFVQIPADGLLVVGHSMLVDESSMTGESEPVCSSLPSLNFTFPILLPSV